MTGAAGAAARERWWQGTVVYQIYPKSFADSNGDGLGDIAGITSRLDHLSDLGVGAIWLCPFYPSSGHDGGYDVSDYCAVDPKLGTLADFDRLVDAAHQRGIRIIIDIVVNHSSDEHPWFRSALDPTSPLRDRYIWAPPRPGRTGGEPGAEPTDSRAAFGGPAWTWHAASGEYYLGVFSPHQPDLNWASAELRAAVAQVLRWWLRRGVDGFRLDVINLIDKPSVSAGEYAHRPGTAPADDVVAQIGNGPRLLDHLRELRAAVLGPRRDVLLLGETPGVSVSQAARLTDRDTGALDLVFAFEHSELDREAARWRSRPFRLQELKRWATQWQTGSGDGSGQALFLSSHDQPRIVSRYGEVGASALTAAPEPDDVVAWARSATAWATVLHAHRGTPFVYQGDEIAMTNHPFGSIGDFADIEARGVFCEAVDGGAHPEEVLAGLRRLSRDNARTPLHWDSGPGAGFTWGSAWLPVSPNHRWLNVASQRGARQVDASAPTGSADAVFPRTPLAYTAALIALRRVHPALAVGSVRILLPDHPHLYAVERVAGEERMLVVANLSPARRELPGELLRRAEGATLVLDNLHAAAGVLAGAATAPADAPSTTVLQPWEARVLACEVRTPRGGRDRADAARRHP